MRYVGLIGPLILCLDLLGMSPTRSADTPSEIRAQGSCVFFFGRKYRIGLRIDLVSQAT